MKPGQMKNTSNPMSGGLSAAAAVGRGSNQTRETCQCSDNPDRMRPGHMAPGPSGKAVVDRDEVMGGQSADLTARTQATYKNRKRVIDEEK